MAEQVKKRFRNPNTVISMAAVLLVAVLCQSSSAESPALAYIQQDFTEIPFSTIQLVTTVPSILMIPASLAYSALRAKFSFRTLFTAGSIILIVGGVAPYFAADFTTILVWRGVFGVGMGVMWPLAQSMIVELYHGKVQDTLLGFNSVVTSLGGILWTNVGGILALQGWRVSFLTYLIPIVILVFCFIFIPVEGSKKKEEKVVEEVVEEETHATGSKFIIAAIVLMVAYFAYNFFNMPFYTNISMKIVDELGLTSANAGLAQSMATVGSLVIGLLFGFIMRAKFMDRYAMGIGWIVTGIGLMILSNADNFALACVACVIQGLGTGCFMPVMVRLIGNLGGKKNASYILGVSTCVLGFSQYLGPTILNMVSESMGLAAGGPVMGFAAGGHLVCGVITLIVLIVLAVRKRGTANA